MPKLHTFYIEIELKFAYIHGECNFISTYLVIVHFSDHPWVLLWKGSENEAEKGVSGPFLQDTVCYTGCQNRVRNRVTATIREKFQKHTRLVTRFGQTVCQTV